MEQLKWHNEKRKLSELAPFEHNPRKLTEKQYADLKKSLSKFDLAEIPAIYPDNKIECLTRKFDFKKLWQN